LTTIDDSSVHLTSVQRSWRQFSAFDYSRYQNWNGSETLLLRFWWHFKHSSNKSIRNPRQHHYI